MSEQLEVDDIPTNERLYSIEEKALRDKFVLEYLRDSNMYAAGVRMGYSGQNALDFSKAMLSEPYVARKIADYNEVGFGMAQTSSETCHRMGIDEAKAIEQRIINGLIKEAFDYSPGSKQQARIGALNKLAEIFKVGSGNDGNLKTNVMVVPAIGSVDSWEQAAMVQQDQLKQDIRH